MTPQAALRERAMMVLRYPTVYRAVMENRIVRHFLSAVPGLEDYAMLGKAWHHTTEEIAGQPKYETVIFDGPATGNLTSMLRIPKVILDAVPAGPLTADARKIHSLLTDPRRTSLWIVTLAEEMPVTEAIDLHRAMTEDLGIAAQRLVVNMVYPDPLASVGAAEARCFDAAPPELAPVFAAARTLHRRHAINAQHLERLTQALPLPLTLVPYVFAPLFNRQTLDGIAQHLEAVT
jgi:anion-transporting  ArsA/GET3 family ATPase